MKSFYMFGFLCLFLTTGLLAQNNATISLPSTATAKFGEEISIPILLSTDLLIEEAQFVVEYDSSVLRFSNAMKGADAENISIDQIENDLTYLPSFIDVNENVLIKISAENSSPLFGSNLEILRLNFNVVGHLGSTALLFDQRVEHTFLLTDQQSQISGNALNFVAGLFTIIPDTSAIVQLTSDTLNILENTHFTVPITVSDVWDLFSFNLSIVYDPNIRRAEFVNEGTFLNNNGTEPTSWIAPAINNTTGNISAIQNRRLAETGVDGDGVLAELRFQAYATGQSAISFINDQNSLFNPKELEIPIAAFIPIEVNIYSESVVKISLPDTSGAPNQQMLIPILISGVESASIISTLFEVSVDTNCLIPLGVQNEGTLTDNWQPPVINITENKLLFATAGYSPITQDGILVFLQFQVNDTAHENDYCDIVIEKVILNEGDPSSIIDNGFFKVQGFQVSGNILYFGTAQPIPDVNVNFDGQLILTNNEGKFNFSELHYGDYVLLPNKQEEAVYCVTPFDAALILQHVVQLTQLSPYQRIAADVTGDGSVSALDAANILQYSVGLIDQFPVMGAANDYWKFVTADFLIDDTNWWQSSDSIAYLPLNTDHFNQDFWGIIYGDVSQNWQASHNPVMATDFTELYLGSTVTLNSSTIEIPLILNMDSEISSVFLEVGFERNNLDFDSINLTSKNHHFDMQYLNSQANSLPDMLEIKKVMLDEKHLLLNTGLQHQNQITEIPTQFVLLQNYPNPFNSRTIIHYAVPNREYVQIYIYNSAGRFIRTLVEATQEAGSYTIDWNGADSSQHTVASGIYFVKLKAGHVKLNRKIIFMK